MTFDTKKIKDWAAIIGAIVFIASTLGSVAVFVAKSYYAKEIQEIEDVIEFSKKAKDDIIPEGIKRDSLQNARMDSIEVSIKKIRREMNAGTSTIAVTLRVDQNGDLYYRAPDLKLYRAYYISEYRAYFYTDTEGYQWECH